VPYLNGRADAISNRGWSREFDDPIALTDGRVLRTLLDAGNYVVALSPKAKKITRVASRCGGASYGGGGPRFVDACA
jgi:hypothetical protein